MRGKRIRCVHVFHPIVTRPQPQAHFTRMVERRRIDGARRHGKYLFLELDRGLIEMHFRFDGQLIWFSTARELLRRANAREGGVHVDLALELTKGVLGFADGRHFGRMHAWESEKECKPLASTEGISHGSAENRGDWQYLFERGAVAGKAESVAAGGFAEPG